MSKQPKARIFIVDDHPLIRKGIRALVNRQPDLVVCGDAGDAQSALATIEQLKPDVALVDLAFKIGNGFELIADLRRRYPQMRILVLSMHDDALFIKRAIQTGAHGYISKEEDDALLLEGIRRVLRGEYVYKKDDSTTT